MEPFHKSAMDIGGCVDLKRAFCGHLEFFGASYDSQSPFRTQKIIPIYCLSYAFTISNLDWRCSTRLEPPDPLMAKKGRFWPHWTLDVPFDAPGWPPLTHKTVAKHHPRCSLTFSTHSFLAVQDSSLRAVSLWVSHHLISASSEHCRALVDDSVV